MTSFIDEKHGACLEKVLQNAEISALVRMIVPPEVAARDFPDKPFVCAIDSPALGTSRAIHAAFGGTLPPTSIEVFNTGTNADIAKMRDAGLAMVVKSDFVRAEDCSKGSGWLRCVVADGMSPLPKTSNLAYVAVNLVDQRFTSVITTTMVMGDRQFGRDARLEAAPHGDDADRLIKSVCTHAMIRELTAHVIDQRLYSSAGKKAKDRMFWALFLLVPKDTSVEAARSLIVDAKRVASHAVAGVQSPLSSMSLRLPSSVRHGFAWQVVPAIVPVGSRVHTYKLETACLPRNDDWPGFSADGAVTRYVVFREPPQDNAGSGPGRRSVAAPSFKSGDFVICSRMVSQEEIDAALREQAAGGTGAALALSPAKWFGSQAFPSHASLLLEPAESAAGAAPRRLSIPLRYADFELQLNSSIIEAALRIAPSAGAPSSTSSYAMVVVIRRVPEVMNFLASQGQPAASASRVPEAASPGPMSTATASDIPTSRARGDFRSPSPEVVCISDDNDVVFVSSTGGKDSDDEVVVLSRSATHRHDAVAHSDSSPGDALLDVMAHGTNVDRASTSDIPAGTASASRVGASTFDKSADSAAASSVQRASFPTVAGDDVDDGLVMGSQPSSVLVRHCCAYHNPMGDHVPPGFVRAADGSQTAWMWGPVSAAVRRRDPAGVKAAIDAGGCTEECPGTRETPLFNAAFLGDLDTVNALIEAGANVNAQNTWGSSSLYMAVLHGHVPVVDALLRAGANMHTRTLGDRTPLGEARKLADPSSQTINKNVGLSNRIAVVALLEERAISLEALRG